ncbi:hypothetical protein N7478_008137 [Penicillium angulare]|uniref:uncharacterized protein n=1 Tax=Penicillium angulare TaxID=116970 RepID=UPI002541F0CE|nr:uncharacterized protein N7478_008137 [Penicillium angulare]KAJ5273012.1 hypothetical protein N7478_008137 [Penicillium angulare]
MPDLWWSKNLDNANGYFGCEATREGGLITGFNTWSFFEVKHLPRRSKYYWSKINVFTRWLPSTKQTCILLFDPTDDLETPLLNPDPSQLNDPFGVYSGILAEVARLQENAVWGIRDHVRDIEKAETPSKTKPQPNYRQLHDIARHAIHVTESLDVAVQNVDHIIKQHELYASLWTEGSTPDIRQHASFQDTSSRLSFFQSHIESIRHRSISNQKRLQNEIQLAFNIVSQHDTKLTVEISAAARSDSATMKTLAFVTLTFLPPTFISAIFTIKIADYLFTRLRQLGIELIFGVPGDCNLRLVDFVEPSGLHWIGNCNELNAAYAVDGYASINGLYALITTYGVGELSAINGIAGAFAEKAGVIHIVEAPDRPISLSSIIRRTARNDLASRIEESAYLGRKFELEEQSHWYPLRRRL